MFRPSTPPIDPVYHDPLPCSSAGHFSSECTFLQVKDKEDAAQNQLVCNLSVHQNLPRLSQTYVCSVLRFCVRRRKMLVQTGRTIYVWRTAATGSQLMGPRAVVGAGRTLSPALVKEAGEKRGLFLAVSSKSLGEKIWTSATRQQSALS